MATPGGVPPPAAFDTLNKHRDSVYLPAEQNAALQVPSGGQKVSELK